MAAMTGTVVADTNYDFAQNSTTSKEVFDPLDANRPDDEVVLTTRRSICRVALLAAETAGRFHRDGLDQDPMSWMLAPLKLFEGSSALDASLDRDSCLRGILLHGLALGLDAQPSVIDALLAEDEDDDDALRPLALHDLRHEGASHRRSIPRYRLYTATIGVVGGHVMLQSFHASVARSRGAIVRRLADRYGADVAASADIRVGFHAANPLALALVPAAVVDVIRRVESGSSGPANRRFVVDIEQRIEA